MWRTLLDRLLARLVEELVDGEPLRHLGRVPPPLAVPVGVGDLDKLRLDRRLRHMQSVDRSSHERASHEREQD